MLPHAGEHAGVGGGGRSDVAALDVGQHVQAAFARVLAGHGVHVHARGAERLIHGDLRFDRGDDARDGVDDGAVELVVGDGKLGGLQFLLAFDGFPDLVGEGCHHLGRHERFRRVEADDAGVLRRVNRFDEAIHILSFRWCFRW